MRIVVIGLGAMGSAALAHLAARGIDAIGLEQFAPGHTRGSSHGWSRVVRQAYFEHADYVPLLQRAFDLWDALEEETGADVLHRPGVLIAGAPASEAIAGSRASAHAHGIEVADLDAAELRRRFPQFALPDDFVGLLEPGGGFAIPEHGNAAHLEVAKRHGAQIRVDEHVQAIEPDGDGVRVVTAREIIRADRVVVTAGAWTKPLLATMTEVSLVPQRKLLVWFEAPGSSFDATRMPAWLIDDAGASGDGLYYGIPTWRGQVGPAGVKVGFHGPGTPIAPGEAGDPDAARVAQFAADMARYMPGLGAPTAATTCTYTMSDDEHFVIDTLPGMPAVTIACGFSGHGYKFAPVIGEILADLATGVPRPDAAFLTLARF